MRRGSALKVAAVGLVGLLAASAATVGGYKAVTGKCLLTGSCGSKDPAVVMPVAATSGNVENCPLGCKEDAVAVETVAHTHETECADKAATCSETVALVAEKDSACCQGEKVAEACGDECPPEGCDKPECCKKVAQNTVTEKVGG